MDRRTKAKVITSIVCMLLSLAALYAFIFVIEVSVKWRIGLVLAAISWLVSGTMNLVKCFKKQ